MTRTIAAAVTAAVLTFTAGCGQPPADAPVGEPSPTSDGSLTGTAIYRQNLDKNGAALLTQLQKINRSYEERDLENSLDTCLDIAQQKTTPQVLRNLKLRNDRPGLTLRPGQPKRVLAAMRAQVCPDPEKPDQADGLS